MMTDGEFEIGRIVWRRLVDAGGFVWSHRDGSKTVHFNKGRVCSDDLQKYLIEHRDLLKRFVDEKERRDAEVERKAAERMEMRSRFVIIGWAIGSSRRKCEGGPLPLVGSETNDKRPHR